MYMSEYGAVVVASSDQPGSWIYREWSNIREDINSGTLVWMKTHCCQTGTGRLVQDYRKATEAVIVPTKLCRIFSL